MTERDDRSGESESLRGRLPIRRIAGILGVIILAIVVLPFIVYAVPQTIGAEHSYVVLSGSMEPAIGPGDVIFVDSVDPASIQVGDVVTYQRVGESRPTTHRVVEIVEEGDGRQFLTMGDANEDPDAEPVSASAVKGRVMSLGGFLFAIPVVGRVVNFAGSQIGFVGLFVVPIALLVVLEIRDIIVTARQGSANDADPSEEPVVMANGGRSPDAATASADADAEEGGGITFRAAELKLGLLVLAAFLAYSIWVAVETGEIWAFGVAGSVATAFLLLLGLYVVGGEEVEAESAEGEAAGTDAEVAVADGLSEGPDAKHRPKEADDRVLAPGAVDEDVIDWAEADADRSGGESDD